MNESLKLNALAILGSVCSNFLLAVFMLFQGLIQDGRDDNIPSPVNRRRFLGIGLSFLALIAVDVSFQLNTISIGLYETTRALWCSLYVGSVLYLLDLKRREVLFIASATATIALLGLLAAPLMMTSLTFGAAYAITAVAFYRFYLRSRGFSSLILSACSTASCLSCALFFVVLRNANPYQQSLGYFHYFLIQSIAIFMAWVQFPREVLGQSPVKFDQGLASTLLLVALIAEIVVQYGLFWTLDRTSLVYIVGNVTFLAEFLLVYYYHRNELWIHTDSMALLLKEVQEQVQIIQRQKEEIENKATIIDRQHRLELAGQTAGQAAHDIQNMLSPIMTLVSKMDQAHAKYPIPHFNELNDSLKELNKLNTELLILSRRGTTQSRPTWIHELITRLVKRCNSPRLKHEVDMGLWVEGSWAQLSRALTNLVNNAFEASAKVPETPVIVRATAFLNSQAQSCHLGFLSPGEWALIEVIDEGPGIPAESLDNIFEPFFSTKDTETRSGTGLGLPTVKAIVDDHQGVLDLDSRPGHTCFRIYLPIIDKPSRATDIALLSGSETVIVADDDSQLRDEYAQIFEDAGYTVYKAPNGREVLRLLVHCHARLLFLDYKMPGLNAYETLKGAIHISPNIACLVHTSLLGDSERVQIQNMGAHLILDKPASTIDVLFYAREAIKESRPKQLLSKPF